MHIRRIARLLAATSVIALALPTIAHAQDATVPDETEAASADNAIIVTAQRRQERVIDVPVSVTVVSAEQLDRQQIDEISDLSRTAPALEMSEGYSNAPGGGGSIRGVGTSTFLSGATAAVGIVVDQVPLGNANFSDLFDIARVEVLKGPQGTLFGLTTSAGVINVSTTAPDPYEMTFKVGGDLSFDDKLGSQFGQQVLRGLVNLPVSDTSALRVSAIGKFSQGPQNNQWLDERNKDERFALRGRYLAEITPDLTVDVIADYSKADQRGVNFFTPISGSAAFRQRVLDDCGITVEEGNPDYCLFSRQNVDSSNYGLSGNISYNLGGVVVTSITAYREAESFQDLQSIFRLDTEFFKLQNGPKDETIKLFTQELRLESDGGGPIEWTAGLFHSDSDTHQNPRQFFRIRGTRPPELLRAFGVTEIEDRSYAAFGQATWHATDALHLTAGVRYTDAKLSFTRALPDGGVVQPGEFNAKEWSWRLAAQYDINPDTMAYASATRGFKQGQITIPDSPTGTPEVLLPEIPLSFEAGLKSVLFDGLVVDLSLFHAKFEDFQAQLCTQDIVNGQVIGIDCRQTNLEYVKSRGAEINFFGDISRELSASAGFIYAKTTYPDGLIGIDGSDLTGEQLLNAPRYKFVFSGQYETPVTENLLGFISADTVWKSKVSYQQSLNPDEAFRDHWIVGGRLGIKDFDERWQASLFVRNLFNVHAPANLLADHYDPGATAAIYTASSYRQVGLSFNLEF
jgi:iron complex outermembrane receptor protein